MAHNPWIVDSIEAGDSSFDSSRLRYSSSRLPSLTFEMFRIGDQIESFLNLNRAVSADLAKVVITIGSQSIEAELPIHEGHMRMRLPTETAQLIIQSLQAGTKVVIDLDGVEETLEPARFSDSYSKFLGKTNFLQNLIRVPL